MNTQTQILETVEFLESLMAGIEDQLADRVDAFADHLGVPTLWINQLLQSTLYLASDDFRGGCLLASSLTHFILKDENSLHQLRSHVEKVYGEQVADYFDEAATYMDAYCGKMHSYYDLYAAATWPEILGKPDDWVWQDANFPADTEMCTEAEDKEPNLDGHITVRDIKCYIRTTVPLSKHEAVFGEAA